MIRMKIKKKNEKKKKKKKKKRGKDFKIEDFRKSDRYLFSF